MSGHRSANRLPAPVRALSSPLLACVLFVAMMLLVMAGTWDEKIHGIYLAQKVFFYSWFIWAPSPTHRVVPIWPGGLTLMTAISINLLLGMVTRLKWKWGNIGLVVVHAGIMFLLISGWVTYTRGVDGQMTLLEGETSSYFESYTEWELAIVDVSAPDKDVEYIVGPRELARAAGDAEITFRHEALPFTVTLTQYTRNAEPEMLGPFIKDRFPKSIVAGDFMIKELPLESEYERNIPALIATIEDKSSGTSRRELFYGLPPKVMPGEPGQPLSLEAGGKAWQISLRRKRTFAPFSITLRKFTHEYYPNTSIPKVYSSDVTQTQGGAARNVKISMNDPLRSHGYTFFQSGFLENPPGAAPGSVSSTLAVVNNPADQWPLYATIIIAAGMGVHFLGKLGRHLRRERKAQR